MIIGEVIRIFQIANNYSNEYVSKNTGFSQSYFSQLKSGMKKVSQKKLEKLAKCFNVKPSQIWLIHELSEEENWKVPETLLEALKNT